MKISKPLDISFQQHLQNLYYAKDMADERDIYRILAHFKKLSMEINYTSPLLFVIDYTRSEYLLMTDAVQLITTYDPRDFMEAGIPMLIDIFQGDDFKVYNEKVFPTNIRFLKEHPQQTHREFVFSYNFRVRSRNGNYVPIWQRGCYITSAETGLPLFSLGMVMDISPFKKDRMIYHTIEKITPNGGFNNKETVVSNCFFPYQEDEVLTRHERNILESMAEGWSSKQIASMMKISENTIANHRKNILKKTNTKNVAELIAFACHSGLL